MFKDVIGFEGLYKVDDKGNIFSIRQNDYISPIEMKSGYLYAHLCNSKKSKLKRIHRIVAEAYLDNPHGYEQVNHKNGNKKDNNVDNLEWCSREQNIQHSIQHGLRKFSGENNPSAKLNWSQVNAIRKEYIYKDKKHGTTALAKKYNVSNVLIGKIVRGESWKEDL